QGLLRPQHSVGRQQPWRALAEDHGHGSHAQHAHRHPVHCRGQRELRTLQRAAQGFLEAVPQRLHLHHVRLAGIGGNHGNVGLHRGPVLDPHDLPNSTCGSIASTVQRNGDVLRMHTLGFCCHSPCTGICSQVVCNSGGRFMDSSERGLCSSSVSKVVPAKIERVPLTRIPTSRISFCRVPTGCPPTSIMSSDSKSQV